MKLFTREQKSLLGLSQKEAQVLTSLQKNGAQNTSALSALATVPRVTTLRILSNLLVRGLVTRKENKHDVVWECIQEERLRKRLDESFALSAHKSMEPIGLSEVGSLMVYRGEKEMLASNEKLLSLHAGERVLTIEPNGIWRHFGKTSPGDWKSLNEMILKKHILLEIVVEEGYEKAFKEYVHPSVQKTFLSLAHDLRAVRPGILDSATEILIFRDQVLFMDWAHFVAVEIKNPSTIRVLRAMYRMLQANAKILRGEKME